MPEAGDLITIDTLTRARAAVDSHAWEEAVEAFSAADDESNLSSDDLRLLGDALWWAGEVDRAIAVFERAYTGMMDEGRKIDAARIAILLAYFATRRSANSVASAWVSRVEHLLEGQPESDVNGWLLIIRIAGALFGETDLDVVIDLADPAIELGKRHDNPAVVALAMSFKGMALIQRGDWRSGLTFLDEATVVAMSEKGDLRAASDVYCNTIAACHNLGDYSRAGEWTTEADRWMQVNSIGGYSGICQVHRAELKRLHGSWIEAEEEARKACVQLERFRLFDGMGSAYYEIGEVRRRMGDLDAAEKAYSQAYEAGDGAQPGMSLLLFDRGDVDAAAASITKAVLRRSGGERSASILSRARLLPAQIEIVLSAGDIETAREAVAELERVALEFEGLYWQAAAGAARGALQVAVGENGEAINSLNGAWRLWRQLDLPYEAARTRVMLGRAHLGAGDVAAARLEFKSARTAFETLGAVIDLKRLREMTGESSEVLAEVATSREMRTFMFTDLVTSTDLIGLIGDAAWESLLEWHDRTLRDAFSRYGGEEVRHTGDGFFVAFSDPRAAIDCAVDIQRRLHDHRREHGFAPWVRIGAHTAEATRKGNDFAGQGVHEAARIGALPDREEIVVSAALLSMAGSLPYPIARAETVHLKGIVEPVEVSWVDWRDRS